MVATDLDTEHGGTDVTIRPSETAALRTYSGADDPQRYEARSRVRADDVLRGGIGGGVYREEYGHTRRLSASQFFDRLRESDERRMVREKGVELLFGLTAVCLLRAWRWRGRIRRRARRSSGRRADTAHRRPDPAPRYAPRAER